MRLALVNDIRCEAAPGLAGICQQCRSPLIPKCGNIRANHWAHRGQRHCDPWWEETEWHIAWKNRFPIEWQENVHVGQNDEKHIADVKLPNDCVLEFQHSPISDIERASREAFYKSMIWIVDGLRRKRDQQSFAKTLRMISHKPLGFTGFESECALLRDWIGRPVDVLFDFGTTDADQSAFGKPVLWQLHPEPKRRVLLTPVYTEAFINLMHKGGALQRAFFNPPQQAPRLSPAQPSQSFQQYSRRLQRNRFRF